MNNNGVTIYYIDDNRIEVQPLVPKKLTTSWSKPNIVNGKTFISYSWREKRQLMEAGYIIEPNDCPPIRNLCNYGYEFYSSAYVRIERLTNKQKRKFTNNYTINGYYKYSGDICKLSDSGFYASWLGNSEYIKIITGLVVYCPVGYGLFQGNIPYYKNKDFEVFSAIEYKNSMGVYEYQNRKYFMVEINAVIKVKSNLLEIKRGDPLGIFYPMLKRTSINIEKSTNNMFGKINEK